ncbi:SH3 domain-containing protein [Acetobacter conturbans]|nr:SH3 domain-containing protein [Acetobacter conturbans]
MNASCSLRAAATLLAAVTTVSLTIDAHAASSTASATPAVHHHKKDAASHTAAKKEAHKPSHHTTATKAKEKAASSKHPARHPESRKNAEHEAQAHKPTPHHKPHAAKHPAAPEAETARPLAAPLPGAAAGDNGSPPAADDAPQDNANGQDPTKGSNTGLPLPRFAALRADDVNMRAGPGQRYPIQWVYHRRGLPVQIEREFDVWRLIEDSDGVKGWVHQATLVGSRDFVVPSPAGSAPPTSTQTAPSAAPKPEGQPTGKHTESRIIEHVATGADVAKIPGAVVLHTSGDEDSAAVAVLTPGSVGTVKTCASGSQWCRVSVQRYEGWVRRNQIWGLLPDEAYPPS